MGYIKWIDGLPKGLKILLTIFVNGLFAAYRIVREALAKNWNLMTWDIVFTVVWPVNWVMDLITICSTGEPFNYAAWFGADGSASSSTEKKDEKPAEEKPAEKPAEEKPAEEKKDDSAK
jgi:hypothetical protein